MCTVGGGGGYAGRGGVLAGNEGAREGAVSFSAMDGCGDGGKGIGRRGHIFDWVGRTQSSEGKSAKGRERNINTLQNDNGSNEGGGGTRRTTLGYGSRTGLS